MAWKFFNPCFDGFYRLYFNGAMSCTCGNFGNYILEKRVTAYILTRVASHAWGGGGCVVFDVDMPDHTL